MPDNQRTLKLIEQVAKEGSTHLNLIGRQLTTMPLEITNLPNLTTLTLSSNQLRSLPPEISNLTKLTRLSIVNNQLSSIPPEIFALTTLEELYLDNNELVAVPPEIIKLNKLRVLLLHANRLTSLPSELADLTKLETLTLGGNILTKRSIGRAIPTSLKELYLPGLNLTAVPPELSTLTKLTTLVLNNNQLTDFPPEILGLSNLGRLELNGNRLTDLPPEIARLAALTHLEISANRLTSVPPTIIQLANLTYLGIFGNELPLPPETFADPEDVKAIFAAIAGLKSGERLNEAKMLVVGDGKVGKSSVVERLIYGTFNPQKQTTLGVEIKDEMKVVQSEVIGEGEPVKLNIWDFGGQEIQHSTHQFFLTTRSLYLLIVDARKGDQLSNIEYWLKLIESFGGDSPIIIVINQIDQLKGQRELNLDRNALKKKYNIKDFVPTACTTGEGISELKAAITREIDQMKHVRDIWPREWIAIKQRLKGMQADYIPVERYLEVCGEEKLSDEDIRQSLLGLLHDLGVIIRFPGDTQVLNPRWVTQGVYGLLTSTRLVKSLGQFDLKDVGEILDGIPETRGRYPSHTHHRLIDVMQHFQLCFEFTDRPGHYLIPRHLHDNELDIPWDDANALKFQYHYETLPDSVISRFIVRMNQYITRQYYWKNGVFLQSGENRAKIKADQVDRKIFISIIGKENTRRAFLAIIRSIFYEINSNFKIEIQQMIPVPGFPQVLVSYKDLLVHEEMNEPEILIPELRRKFSVRELLDGVEELSTRLGRREHDFIERRFPERMPEEIQHKLQLTLSPSKNNPLGSLMSFVVGFVVLLGAIVGAAVAISKWVSVAAGVMTGLIIIGAMLAIGVVGAMGLRNDGRISEDNFLRLMIESYKNLPLLRGKGDSDELPEK